MAKRKKQPYNGGGRELTLEEKSDNHFDGRKRYIEESLFLMKDKLELKRFKPRKCSSHHSEQLLH